MFECISGALLAKSAAEIDAEFVCLRRKVDDYLEHSPIGNELFTQTFWVSRTENLRAITCWTCGRNIFDKDRIRRKINSEEFRSSCHSADGVQLQNINYLKHLVLSYESVYLVGTFPNVTYVGITGEIHSEPYAETDRLEDVEQLHLLMKALKNQERFPNLRTVQLRDVSRDKFRDTVWNSWGAFCWMDWIETLAQHEAEVTEADGYQFLFVLNISNN